MAKPLLPLLRDYQRALSRSVPRRAATEKTLAALRKQAPAGARQQTPSKLRQVCSVPVVRGLLIITALSSLAVAVLRALPQELDSTPQTSAAPPLGLPPCVVHRTPHNTEYQGRCELHLPYVSVSSERDSLLWESSGQVTILRGRARFRVAPVPPGEPPVRVGVSGGVIEVLGTEFWISQDAEQGHVELVSGHIRFRAHSQAAHSTQTTHSETDDATRHDVELVAGQTHAWRSVSKPQPAAPDEATPDKATPDKAVPLPSATSVRRTAAPSEVGSARPPRRSPTPTAYPTPPANQPPKELEVPAPPPSSSGIARLLALRAEGRYREALELSQHLGNQANDPATREVLSYERGTLLERIDARQACQHFERHLRRFETGRYREPVRKKLERCLKNQETNSGLAGE